MAKTWVKKFAQNVDTFYDSYLKCWNVATEMNFPVLFKPGQGDAGVGVTLSSEDVTRRCKGDKEGCGDLIVDVGGITMGDYNTINIEIDADQ